MAPPIN
ncbi:hypothetical protein JL09_g6055, partial [Pichia kudriavzevii]